MGEKKQQEQENLTKQWTSFALFVVSMLGLINEVFSLVSDPFSVEGIIFHVWILCLCAFTGFYFLVDLRCLKKELRSLRASHLPPEKTKSSTFQDSKGAPL
jgi:hypothetical protein